MSRLQNLVAYYGRANYLGDHRETAERYERQSLGHIIERYWEPYSRRGSLPALVKALDHAKRTDAHLLITSFSSMARDPLFLKLLWDSKVEFAACDNEFANKLTLPLLASLRIREAEAASQRIKQELHNASHRVRNRRSLGTPANLKLEHRYLGGAATKRRHSTLLTEGLQALLLETHAEGKSLRQIASKLNDSEHQTKSGKPWSHTSVGRVLHRSLAIEAARTANREKWQSEHGNKPQ